MDNTTIREQIRSAKSESEVRKIISGYVNGLLVSGKDVPTAGRGRPKGKDWFREAWIAFLGDKNPAIVSARDEDARKAFKEYLTPERMKVQGWHAGEPIGDAYFNMLVSQRLKRTYELKDDGGSTEQ